MLDIDADTVYGNEMIGYQWKVVKVFYNSTSRQIIIMTKSVKDQKQQRFTTEEWNRCIQPQRHEYRTHETKHYKVTEFNVNYVHH